MNKVLYLSFLLLLAAGPSYGQSNEVSYSAGATFMSSQTQTVTFPTLVPCPIPIPNCNVLTNTMDASHGFTFEASYARRLIGEGPVALYVELPVVGTPGHGVTTVVNDPFVGPISGSSSSSLFFLTPSARVKFFPSARISPWVTVGGGWARLSQGGLSANNGALQFGGGVDFQTGVPNLALRVEARDFWSASPLQTGSLSTTISGLTATVSPDHLHHVFAGGGVVLRF